DQDLADDHRQDAEVPRADVGLRALPEAGLLGRVAVRHLDAGCDDVGPGAHVTSPAVSAMPATFVGIPAVIAETTSCCVVVARSYTPTSRPRRRTVMRVATSKMSWRLCDTRMTASPCSASRLTSSSTWRVCRTPSAAVGSSKSTSREVHCQACA